MENNTIVRLKASDYDEALDFMNLIFSQTGRPTDFEKLLPKMCVPDDEHMNRHFAIKEDGRIRSLLGVYPLKTWINGQSFLFSTVGNVATHAKVRRRGYMTRLMEEAMKELDRIGADAARLDGLRQRYGRFGFEKAGSLYDYTLTARNVRICFGDLLTDDIHFQPIKMDDTHLLEQAWTLFYRREMAVDRNNLADFYLTLQAWQMSPWAAFDTHGRMIGYFTVSKDGQTIAEQMADSTQNLVEMFCAWIVQRGCDSLSFRLSPWELDAARVFNRICEEFTIIPATHFLIRNYVGLTDALLAIRARLNPLPPGMVRIGIDDYDTLELKVDNNKGTCQKTLEKPDVQVDRKTATRLLFGPMPPGSIIELSGKSSELLTSWLPLPLSWMGQDRV